MFAGLRYPGGMPRVIGIRDAVSGIVREGQTMKTIELTPNEFYDFKEVAKKFKIFFTCTVIAGIVLVDADAVMLDYIGY